MLQPHITVYRSGDLLTLPSYPRVFASQGSYYLWQPSVTDLIVISVDLLRRNQ